MKGKWFVMTGAFLFIGSLSSAAAEKPQKQWYPTGSPELAGPPPPEHVRYLLYSKPRYAEFAEKIRDSDTFVPISEMATETRPLQGCGFNLVFGEKNRSFCVHGTAQCGYLLYADVDADGSLRDERPIGLSKSGSLYTAVFEAVAKGVANGTEQQYPVKVRFVLTPNEKSSKSDFRYTIQDETFRHGTIQLESEEVAFALRGQSGVYDAPHHALWLDLNGDGQGYGNNESEEIFFVRDEHLNIGDKSYRFEVDRFGRNLGLIPLDESAPSRPSLAVGAEAPGFRASDIDDDIQTLESYRDHVVLLDFWFTTCAPCIKDAPRLADLYERHADDGLRIIGISPDSESEVRKFTARFGHDWPQVLETIEDPIHTDYRVRGYPAKFLIDRDGRILCGRTGPGFWEECWPKAQKALRP